MRAVIHCVRHAEGLHNLEGPESHNIIDPALTEKGQDQCLKLRNEASSIHSRISLIAASPMTRTLQTAFLAFQPALENGHCRPQIIGVPDAQEVCDYPFNTGSDPSVLREIAYSRKIPVDLAPVPEGWNTKAPGSRYFPSRVALNSRARDCRRQMFELACALRNEGVQDPELVLVAHAGILHFFTEDWEDAGMFSGGGWRNAEMRSYHLDLDMSDNENENCALVETPESRQRRGKGSERYSAEEQDRLFEKAMDEWERQGLHEIP